MSLKRTLTEAFIIPADFLSPKTKKPKLPLFLRKHRQEDSSTSSVGSNDPVYDVILLSDDVDDDEDEDDDEVVSPPPPNGQEAIRIIPQLPFVVEKNLKEEEKDQFATYCLLIHKRFWLEQNVSMNGWVD